MLWLNLIFLRTIADSPVLNLLKPFKAYEMCEIIVGLKYTIDLIFVQISIYNNKEVRKNLKMIIEQKISKKS